MNNEIFRKKSLDRLNSPDEFDQYVKVSRPGVWILVIGILLVLAGIFIWGLFGDIPTYVDVGVVKQLDGTYCCLIREEDMDKVKEGMSVECEGQTYTVTNLSYYDNYDTVEEVGVQICRLLGFQDSTWIYVADISGGPKTDGDGVYKGRIEVSDVKPFSFIFN